MKHLQLKKDISNKIQELLKNRPKKQPEISVAMCTPPRYDKTYFEAIIVMDKEDKEPKFFEEPRLYIIFF